MISVERRGASGSEVVKDLIIYYRTANMEEPVLLAQKSDNHPNDVAVLFSFVPSFQEKQPGLTPLESAVDEKPEPQELAPEIKDAQNLYIFIVDRSGSMSGKKMETTKEALIIFLKSLPSDAYFEIVSFGDTFDHMCKESNKGFSYTDKNVEKAIQQVRVMSANMGGTEIYEPL
jgi:hypothetical protein